MIAWPAKDPNEELDYTWSVPLDANDAISTFTASVASGSVSIQGSPNFSGSLATTFFSGGLADESAQVTLTAVTVGGRTFRESAVLPIIDRASSVLAAFRLRYPAFHATTDGVISYWLADAGVQVSAWPDNIQASGRLAHAAHKLAEQGQGGALPQGVTSFKSGTFSATVEGSQAQKTGLHATVYGREFLELARQGFAGPRLAWKPAVNV